MPPKKEYKASIFRGKLPNGVAKGSQKRHKLSCEIVATAYNHTPGRKPAERKVKSIAKTISKPDNIHRTGGRKKNMEDHKADRKLIDAYKNGTEAKLSKQELSHVRAGANFAHDHRKEIGIGPTRIINKIYGTARTSDGKRAVPTKRV